MLEHELPARPRLFYIDDIPTPYRLGVFRHIAEKWPGAFRVAFCAENEPGRKFDLDFSGLDVDFLEGFQWRPLGQVNPFSLKWNPGVIRALEHFDPQVVVLSGYAHPTMMRAARWCLSRGVPYAITCETSAKSTVTAGPRWEIRRRVVGWMVRNISFGLPAGREAAAYLRRLGPTDAPMYFFPNTPDTAIFVKTAEAVEALGSAHDLRKALGLPLNGPLFTFVGRLIGAKNPLHVVQAFRSIGVNKDAALLMVGDGPQAATVREHASGDRRIVCAGWTSNQQEIARILASSQALVLPSAHEPWGAVVNEAMASKACVIATDHVGAAAELVENGVEGFIVSVSDVSAIRDAMLTLIDDPERCRRMGEAAQEKAIRHGAVFAATNLARGATDALARV